MTQRHAPSWLDETSLAATLRDAEGTATRTEIVDALVTHVFPDVPRRRVETIVENATARLEAAEGRAVAGEPITTDDTPRELSPRYVAVEDFEYLTDREFAQVFAVVIEQFGGNARLATTADDVAVDLFWNRAYDTVAFRTVTRPATNAIDEDPVTEVVDGSTVPSEGRAPSTVAVVGNTTFSRGAVDVAEANDVLLFDGAHVALWLSYAKISQRVQGAVLEDGDRRDVPREELLEDVEESPSAVRAREPLAMQPDEKPTESAASVTRSEARQSIPVDDDQPERGATGVLYADPAEDSDYGAFNDVIEKLDEVTDR